MLGDGGFDWITLGAGLLAVVVAWTVLKSVLRLTVKMFTLGCSVLLILASLFGATLWFRS